MPNYTYDPRDPGVDSHTHGNDYDESSSRHGRSSSSRYSSNHHGHGSSASGSKAGHSHTSSSHSFGSHHGSGHHTSSSQPSSGHHESSRHKSSGTSSSSSRSTPDPENPYGYTMPLPSQGRVGGMSKSSPLKNEYRPSAESSLGSTTAKAYGSTSKPAAATGTGHSSSFPSRADTLTSDWLPTPGRTDGNNGPAGPSTYPGDGDDGNFESGCGCPLTKEEKTRRVEARNFARGLRGRNGEYDGGFERLTTGFWPKVPGRPWAFDGIIDPGDD